MTQPNRDTLVSDFEDIDLGPRPNYEEFRCPFCGITQQLGCNHHIIATAGPNFTDTHLKNGLAAASFKRSLFEYYDQHGKESVIPAIDALAYYSDLVVTIRSETCRVRGHEFLASIYYCSTNERTTIAIDSAWKAVTDHATLKQAIQPPQNEKVFSAYSEIDDPHHEASQLEKHEEEHEEETREILNEIWDDADSYERSSEEGWFYDDDR